MPHMGALASRTKWGQTALTSLGSGGPWDKARSSVLDPLALGLLPVTTDPHPGIPGGQCGPERGHMARSGGGWGRCLGPSLLGEHGIARAVRPGTRDQAGVLKAAPVSQSTHWQRQARPWKPQVRAPRPLTLPSVASRGHTFRGHNRHPVCTLLTLGLRIQATTCDPSHRRMAVLTVFSRTRHAWLLGGAGEHWREGERAVCHQARPRKVPRHVRPTGRTPHEAHIADQPALRGCSLWHNCGSPNVL